MSVRRCAYKNVAPLARSETQAAIPALDGFIILLYLMNTRAQSSEIIDILSGEEIHARALAKMLGADHMTVIRNLKELLNSRMSVKIGEYDRSNPLIKEIEKKHVIIKGVEPFYEKIGFRF
jgi:hypothetical protein